MNSHIHFQNINITPYFLFVSLGLVAGCIIFVFHNKELKKYRNDLFYCFLYTFVGIIIGAKLLYILSVLKYLIQHPNLWIYILDGGLVFYGGVIGGIIGALLYIRTYKMPLMDFLDNAALAIPIGHAIGRLGCLFGGCCYGKPTNSIFGIIYPESNLIAPSSIRIHPVQLYESIANLLVFFTILIISRKYKTKGMLGGMYFMLYGVARFTLEFLRADFRGNVWFLSTSQFISIFMILVGMILFVGKYNDKLEKCLEKKTDK